jgi:hypothetical protein
LIVFWRNRRHHRFALFALVSIITGLQEQAWAAAATMSEIRMTNQVSQSRGVRRGERLAIGNTAAATTPSP